MSIIVQKYGGTSVNTKQRRTNILRNVREVLSSGDIPVVVVSAMGRFPDAYSTDSLLALLSEAGKADSRNRDLIASCGEIISAAIVSAELSFDGIASCALTGEQAGIVTDGIFTGSEITRIDTKKIFELTEKSIVPVIAGFQGVSENGEITTLGRGGSDTTAAALGDALGAKAVEIYTDVDGIFITDPKLVENVALISKVNYDDVYKMAAMGAKVIHPRAVEYAAAHATEMYVLNVNKPRLSGDYTLICKSESRINGVVGFIAITLEKNEQAETVRVIGSLDGMAEKVSSKLMETGNITPVNKDGVISFCVLPGEGGQWVKTVYESLMK